MILENQSNEHVPAESEFVDNAVAKKPSKLALAFKSVHWRLYARFPNIVPDPYWRDTEYIKSRDIDENERTRVEQSHDLRLCSIIVYETFSANEIEDLYTSLAKLGWDRPRFSPSRDNIDWLKQQILYGHTGSLSFGLVMRPNAAKPYATVDYTAQFPKEFDYLVVKIWQAVPSVLVLSACFVLNESNSRVYEETINENRKSTRRRDKRHGGVTIHQVAHLKEEGVQAAGNKYRTIAIDWVKANLKGYFSSQKSTTQFPTAELLSFKNFEPFDKQPPKDRDWNHWSRFANLDTRFSSWRCKRLPALHLAMNDRDRNPLRNHVTVALQVDKVDNLREWQSVDSLLGQVNLARDHFDGALTKHAFICFMRDLIRRMKEIRQSVPDSIRRRGSNDGVSEIVSFFQNLIGAPRIASEAVDLSKSSHSFKYDAGDFEEVSMRPIDDKASDDFSERVQRSYERFGRQLGEEDVQTREFLNQLISAIGIRESIFAQRRAMSVALISLCVALLSVAATFI